MDRTRLRAKRREDASQGFMPILPWSVGSAANPVPPRKHTGRSGRISPEDRAAAPARDRLARTRGQRRYRRRVDVGKLEFPNEPRDHEMVRGRPHCRQPTKREFPRQRNADRKLTPAGRRSSREDHLLSCRWAQRSCRCRLRRDWGSPPCIGRAGRSGGDRRTNSRRSPCGLPHGRRRCVIVPADAVACERVEVCGLQSINL